MNIGSIEIEEVAVGDIEIVAAYLGDICIFDDTLSEEQNQANADGET